MKLSTPRKCGATALLLNIMTLANGEEPNFHRLRKNTAPQQQQLEEKLAPTSRFLIEGLDLQEDAYLWTRILSDPNFYSMSLSMPIFDSCVPEDVEEFKVKKSVDIGDVLLNPEDREGFTKSCGPDCYTLMDNGDDPPFDPERGDTAYFAYNTISSNHFSIRSRICGVDCDVSNEEYPEFCGRVGLMVRENTDPFARNFFVSHIPFVEARWSWRSETNGEYKSDYNGGPDAECQWITLIRDGDDFSFTTNIENEDKSCLVCDEECDAGRCIDGCPCEVHNTVTIPDMPKRVLVGLAVSTPVNDPSDGIGFDPLFPDPFRATTEANFRDIELRDGDSGTCKYE